MTKIEMSDDLRNFFDEWGCETLDEAMSQSSLQIEEIGNDIYDLKERQFEMEELHSELIALIEVHGEGCEVSEQGNDYPVTNFAQARACFLLWARRFPGEPQMPNENLSDEHDGYWHLNNVNGALAVVNRTGDVIAVGEFWAACERLSEAGKCDSPGGAEYRRVLHEWIENQPDDMEEFIVRRANVGPRDS